MKNSYSDKEVLSKIQHYCAYRERCTKEVSVKLKEYGIAEEKREKIINKLIEESFLDEQRFAEVFSSSKFRINKWGKYKIKAELRKHNVPEEFIINGLNEIDETEYLNSLETLIEKKRETLIQRNKTNSLQKLATYAISKGYESELVWNCLRK